METCGATFVLNYKKTNSYALNVIAGAVEKQCTDVEIVFARTPEAVCSAARETSAPGRRVVIAWSFYSPLFEENYREFRELRTALRGIEVLHLVGGVHATAEP